MSEALPLMTAALPSQGTGQPNANLAKAAPDGAAQGFPALFAAMNFAAQDPATQLPAPLPMLPAALLEDPAFAALEPGMADDAASQTLQMFTGQLQQAGNELPQVGWTGMLAAGDGEIAQAVQMQGDEQSVRSVRQAVARDLPTAVQRAQTPAMDELPVLPMTQELELQQQLAGRDTAGLRLERGLLVDSSAAPLQTLTSATSTPTSTQFATLLDGAALGGMSARVESATQSLQLPVQHPQWGQQVSERVHWMISQNMQQADLRLNPPELGSLEVRIQVQGDQATVNFSSPHASVRDALDAALPRLREMLQEAGLSLGNSNVSDQALAQRDSGQSGGHAGASTGGGSGEAVGLDGEAQPMANGRSGVGLVDLYA